MLHGYGEIASVPHPGRYRYRVLTSWLDRKIFSKMPNGAYTYDKWRGVAMAKTPKKTTSCLAFPDVEHKYLREPTLALVQMVREGVPYADYQVAIEGLGLNLKEAARIMHVPTRTLSRREDDRLKPQEGERFMRLLRLVAQATDVLGSQLKALSWLEAPNRALEGATPMSLLDTDIGTQAAEAVLTRIEYGVFS